MPFPKYLQPLAPKDLIRIGSDGDGGYIMPERIFSEISAMLSMGLSDDWSFEEAVREKSGSIPIIIFDHSVNLKFWLRRSAAHLIKGIFTGNIARLKRLNRAFQYYQFFSQDNCTHYKLAIGKADNMINLEQALAKLPISHNILLKIDIESYEYQIIDEIIERQDQFAAIAIEMHLIDQYADETRYFVESMRKKFELVHMHANNYAATSVTDFSPIIELSFINRNLLQDGEILTSHSLPIAHIDAPSVPGNPDIIPVFE